ncbi:MAG: hypothetical protein AB1414_03235 [bacterium]
MEDFRPMCTAGLKAPPDDKELSLWANDSGDFKKRSAAIIYLAEKESPSLKDAANKASKDPYWQVRMASVLAENIKPGTLTAESRAGLEKDHVYYVKVGVSGVLSHHSRLEDMSVREIEFLHRKGITSSIDKRPENPDDFFSLIRGFISSSQQEYLLLLAEYFITDVYVGMVDG